YALAQTKLPLTFVVNRSEVMWYLLNVLPLGLVPIMWTVLNAPRVFNYDEYQGKKQQVFVPPPAYCRPRHSRSYGGHYEYPVEQEFSYPMRAPAGGVPDFCRRQSTVESNEDKIQKAMLRYNQAGGGALKKKMNGYVGFSNFPNQEHRRSIKRGFNFTLMVVGESGLGKSTLINTLFEGKVYPTKDTDTSESSAAVRSGVEITSVSADIQENGVRLRLSVVDTPGFGDSINNEEAW
ncbi:Cell division control protein 3, partial [Coemansia aciculifera]